MKEKPILFSTEMVRAILEGRKTQTRRIMKFPKGNGQKLYMKCPYQLGMKLWLRETWTHTYTIPKNIYYKADMPDNNVKCKWKPSIFMPKEYARIWLEVIGIRVERVQDITGDDILSEGIMDENSKIIGGYDIHNTDIIYNKWVELWDSINAKRGYSWESNPFVWVIEFQRMNYENNS